MSERLRIRGGIPLHGTCRASGSKNAGFPILAATVLSERPVKISNIPDISDIRSFIELLRRLGVKTTGIARGVLAVDSSTIMSSNVDALLGSTIRGSYYFLGALLGLCGRANIPFPGGCQIGVRPMDLHLKVFEELGCQIGVETDGISALAPLRNRVTDVSLPFPSRGVTINLLLYSARRWRDELTIHNPNTSPEVFALIDFLTHSGVVIDVTQNSTLYVRGCKHLVPSDYSIITDKIEVATLLLAGAITEGRVTVENVTTNITSLVRTLDSIGVDLSIDGPVVTVDTRRRLTSAQIIPGLGEGDLDADFEPLLAALLCFAHGESYIEDRINPSRHANYLPAFQRAGVEVIMVSDSEARIRPGVRLEPFRGEAKDIRGGAAQVLLALGIHGMSVIEGASQIDRGYEKLDHKLRSLGATIERDKAESSLSCSK